MIDFLTPPPRYDHCRFENYQTDSVYPSQADVKARLSERVRDHAVDHRKWYYFGRREPVSGVYLDGLYGVGKTHLLAAAYHEFAGPKAYLSFTHLMALISFHKMDSVLNQTADLRLICIDEFELDDPANTMKAAQFIRVCRERFQMIITTSNTVPGELGKGRFHTDQFQVELGELAAGFDTFRIDGVDFRTKGLSEDYYDLPHQPQPVSGAVAFETVKGTLADTPLVRYRDVIQTKSRWPIIHVVAFQVQDHALRFTHFVDTAYDLNIPVTLTFLDPSKQTLFNPEFLHGMYEKKYRRCLSRLHEMAAS